MNPSLYLDRARFAPIWHHIADLPHHTDITLQDVPNRVYTLKLFVGNEEVELEKTGNRSWTLTQRQ